MRKREFFATGGTGEVLENFVAAFKGKEYFIAEKRNILSRKRNILSWKRNILCCRTPLCQNPASKIFPVPSPKAAGQENSGKSFPEGRNFLVQVAPEMCNLMKISYKITPRLVKFLKKLLKLLQNVKNLELRGSVPWRCPRCLKGVKISLSLLLFPYK